jgi:hypothetical protein
MSNIEKPSRENSDRYLARVRELVELLRAEDRTTGQLADLLCCTASGVRNYMRPLRYQGLIQAVGKIQFSHGGKNTLLLRIDPDQAKVDECLRVLAVTPNPGTSARDGNKVPRVKLSPELKVLCGDQYVVCKPVPVTPPRHWMDRVLFGDGPAPSARGVA